jgi:hypothetical protein
MSKIAGLYLAQGKTEIDKAERRITTQQHRDMLESNPERVRSFFQDKRVKYAA